MRGCPPLKEKMDSFDLVQLCSQQTHLDRNGKPESLLDLIFTNTLTVLLQMFLPPISTSDHLPVVLNCLKTKSTQPQKSEGCSNRIKWLFERKDKERVSDAFLHENWEQAFQPFNDINETWNRWKLQFFEEIKSFFSHRTVTNSLKHRTALWFTKDLKKLTRVKNCLFKKACSSGTDNNWETYRSARNKATREIKKAKLDYVKRQANTLADQKCNLSRWWSIARDLCGLRARGIRVCHLSWTNQRTLFWTIKRKPTFWTTSLLTRTHPLLFKPFLLGRHLYKKRLTLINIAKGSCWDSEISAE